MIHDGHRQRMLERLGRGERLQEHELLEIILYSSIPRKNTNEIAHALLNAFGSIHNVFHADLEKLTAVPGVGVNVAGFLVCLGKAMDKIIDYRENDLASAYSFESFSKYLERRFQFAKQEYIELYSIKKNGKVEFCQRYSSDESDRVKLSRTEIVKFVADFSPRQAILVHNHCSSDCHPSAQDDNFTKYVCLSLMMFGVKLLDHYIVSPDGIYSYHMHRELDPIRRKSESIVKEALL